MAELTDSMKETLEVIGLNVDTPDTWKAKGKDNPVSWYDFNEEKESYGLNLRFETMGIPAFVIISKEGVILDVWSGYREGIIAERITKVI